MLNQRPWAVNNVGQLGFIAMHMILILKSALFRSVVVLWDNVRVIKSIALGHTCPLLFEF